MAKLTVDHARDLAAHIGQPIGASHWVGIKQADIDDFARLTGDDHWIHVDPARAATEMPGGRTIAHGLYVLSLIPALSREIYKVERRGRGLNYGYDRVRFISPVPCSSRVRLVMTVSAVKPHAIGTLVEADCILELEGAAKPAVAARNTVLIGDP